MITSNHAITIVPLSSGEHLAQAATLYREVFGYTRVVDGLSPRLLRGLVENGGLVVGALDHNAVVVGFAFGFQASDASGSYHYSQAAVVSHQWQGQQLGRQLKIQQAILAAQQGHTRMRWAYDPAQVRNAHFNLNVLGAYGLRFSPDYYDDGDSDRIIIQWELGPAGPPELKQVIPSSSESRIVMVDRNIPRLRRENPVLAKSLSVQLASELATCFSDGLVLTSCELSSQDSASYVFTRP